VRLDSPEVEWVRVRERERPWGREGEHGVRGGNWCECFQLLFEPEERWGGVGGGKSWSSPCYHRIDDQLSQAEHLDRVSDSEGLVQSEEAVAVVLLGGVRELLREMVEEAVLSPGEGQGRGEEGQLGEWGRGRRCYFR
jgi:hypothetical protein